MNRACQQQSIANHKYIALTIFNMHTSTDEAMFKLSSELLIPSGLFNLEQRTDKIFVDAIIENEHLLFVKKD